MSCPCGFLQEMKCENAYFNWSGGKDSALALYRVLCSKQFSVKALFTVLKCDSKKIAMHEVGVDLLRKQADAIGIPLVPFYFDNKWTGAEYELAMMRCMREFKNDDITTALFGDLYLEPLRSEREQKCHRVGINSVFPLWGMPTDVVMSEFIQLGFKAIVTCVDNSVLSENFIGRIIDNQFISDLPGNVDICGENGEYHSFVFDGPIFRRPVDFRIVRKYSMVFTDSQEHDVSRYTYLELA